MNFAEYTVWKLVQALGPLIHEPSFKAQLRASPSISAMIRSMPVYPWAEFTPTTNLMRSN